MRASVGVAAARKRDLQDMLLSADRLNAEGKSAAMIIQKQEEFDVVGLSERVSNDEPSSIAALWSQFYNSGLRERLPSVVGSNIYAVYHAYKGDQSAPYVMTIGYRVPAGAACPADLSRVSIPSQDYAVFEAVGAQPQALISQWAAIWNTLTK